MSNKLVAIRGIPGGGKTTEAIKMIKKKLGDELKLEDIVFSTYRKPLATKIEEDLKDKLDKPELPKEMKVGTTHKICRSLLAREGIETNVADEDHKLDFCKSYGYTPYKSQYSMGDEFGSKVAHEYGNMLFELKTLKNNNLGYDNTISKIPNRLKGAITEEELEEFIKNWNEYKEDQDLIDFDDMLLKVNKLGLSPDKKLLVEDEFHDKTPLQYEIYKMWKMDIPIVYVLGDPLQAIYNYKGTSPDFFEREYSRADITVDKMKSYRYGSTLWDYVSEVARRYDIEPPETEDPSLDEALNDTTVDKLNYYGFKEKVKDLQDEETSVLILVRANYMKSKIVKTLNNSKVDFEIGYESESTKEARKFYNKVSYIRTEAKKKVSDTGGVYGSFEIDLHHETVKDLINTFKASNFGVSGSVKDGVKKELRRKVENNKKVGVKLSPSFIDTILNRNPFKLDFLSTTPDYVKNQKLRLVNKWDNLEGEFWNRGSTTILTTFHGSKGREADHVFVFNGKPWSIEKKIRDGKLKDEGRVIYTTLTRASKGLWIVNDRDSRNNYNFPNPWNI